ncbi:MAG: hypothetical protein RJB62_1911 [Pseudomonadota bacterium]
MTRPSLTPSVIVLAFALSACASTAAVSPTPPPANEFAGTIAEDIEGAVHMAQMQRAAGNLDGATITLGQLVLVAPNNPRVLGEYGKTLVDKGEFADALAFLQRAIELDPSEWSYLSAQGVAYAQRGEYDLAQTAFARALALHPNEPAILNNLALTHLQAGNLDEAETLLNQAAANGMAYPKIAQNLALVRQLKASGGTRVPVSSPTSEVQVPETVAEIAVPEMIEVASVAPLSPPSVVQAALPEVPVATAPQQSPPMVVSAPVRSSLTIPSSGPIYLQVGAFASEENAARVSDNLADLNPHTVPTLTGERVLHRVSVGPFANDDEARSALDVLHVRGLHDVQIMTRLPEAVSTAEAAEAVPVLKLEPELPQSPEAPESPPDLRFSEKL